MILTFYHQLLWITSSTFFHNPKKNTSYFFLLWCHLYSTHFWFYVSCFSLVLKFSSSSVFFGIILLIVPKWSFFSLGIFFIFLFFCLDSLTRQVLSFSLNYIKPLWSSKHFRNFSYKFEYYPNPPFKLWITESFRGVTRYQNEYSAAVRKCTT